MHFLLIPYALLSVLFVMQYLGRRLAGSRGGLFVTAVATGMMVFVALMVRPASGDSGRYYQHFQTLRGFDLSGALAYQGSDPLFAILNWLTGLLGSAQWLLFGATLLVFFSVFMAALHRLLSPVAVATVLMSYVMFPFFVAYAGSGLRQGLGMAFVLMALVQLYRGKRAGWVWLLAAPYWHSGAWLAVIVIVAHQVMMQLVRRTTLRWMLVFGALVVSVVLSATGFNAPLLGQLPAMFEIQAVHMLYFTDASDVGYRAGFRPDFLLFSLIPLATAFALRRNAPTFDHAASGWWLSIYIALNILYHLFAFAPFADRFASFSWFLMPLVVFLQVEETRNRQAQAAFVIVVSAVNIAMLQLYTGEFFPAPEWW